MATIQKFEDLICWQKARELTREIYGAFSIIGGGDTVAAVEKTGVIDRFSFVSTGGGAMLAFLAKGTLPGIEALKKSKKYNGR